MSRILVIDDSVLMRKLLPEYLEPHGHEVEAWLPLSAMEIPERLKAFQPDLVLTDFVMPGLNGLTVAQMCQRTKPEMPVVVLTAQRDPEMDAKLLKFGVKRILHKPIGQEQLVAALQEILG